MTNKRLYQWLDTPDHLLYLFFQSPGDESLPIGASLPGIRDAHQPVLLFYNRHSLSHRTRPGHSSALVSVNITSVAAINVAKFQAFC